MQPITFAVRGEVPVLGGSVCEDREAERKAGLLEEIKNPITGIIQDPARLTTLKARIIADE